MPRGDTFYRNAVRPTLDAPAPRPRIGAGLPLARERHGRTEGTNGEITLADASALVFTASGLPDLYVFSARTNGALIVLDDLGLREDDALTVLPGTPVEVRLPRRFVYGRNLVAGANAALSITAYFALKGEPFDAPA